MLSRKTQEEVIEDMMRRPIPRKRVGIIHLEMVRECRCLNGMRRMTDSREAVNMVRPLFEKADRELMLVLSLSAKLEPLALEVAAVGGLDTCSVDVRNLFKHTILNNGAYVACFHNHPSGDPAPSRTDRRVTERIGQAGAILGIPLLDHIIIGNDGRFFSFREEGLIVSELPDDAA